MRSGACFAASVRRSRCCFSLTTIKRWGTLTRQSSPTLTSVTSSCPRSRPSGQKLGLSRTKQASLFCGGLGFECGGGWRARCEVGSDARRLFGPGVFCFSCHFARCGWGGSHKDTIFSCVFYLQRGHIPLIRCACASQWVSRAARRTGIQGYAQP